MTAVTDKVLPTTPSKRYVTARLKAAVAGVETMVAKVPITSLEDAQPQVAVISAVIHAHWRQDGGDVTAEALRPAWRTFGKNVAAAGLEVDDLKTTVIDHLDKLCGFGRS